MSDAMNLEDVDKKVEELEKLLNGLKSQEIRDERRISKEYFKAFQ